MPAPLAWIEQDLVAAAKRGVRIAARVYAPCTLKGVTVAMAHDPERIMSAWPGEQLSIAMDGEQFLTALVGKGGHHLHQAIWSNSTFLSCMHYNALQSELVMTDLQTSANSLHSGLETLSLTRLKPPGLIKLHERYGDAASEERAQRPRKGR